MGNLEWLKNQKENLLKEVSLINTKIKVIEELINIAENELNISEMPPPKVVEIDKSNKEKLRERFIEALEMSGVFSKSREIATLIVTKYDGEVQHTTENISRYTSKWINEGFIVKIQIGSDPHKTWWGLPNWLENGQMKKERVPK